jgi:hypothetical protein
MIVIRRWRRWILNKFEFEDGNRGRVTVRMGER